ncbi:galectin-4-like isoform X2 [Scyliorhinus canicula]|uniref:galectin-4-like isoform X2 n=1 Tax=Scyliorhinus canicula TaxID=7830 RepID=UPI0018F6F89C|nr:galectin-4-like isoform X2 [Scyliorhinus canicula]
MDFYSNPLPVINPSIPYTGPIPGGLQDGKMIMIKGRVLPHTNRFHVNLHCGQMAHHCDVAFHFNPRYESTNYVVCNSFESQRWCSEERKHEVPIQRGETFQLLILVQSDCYKVAVNDKHFLEFKHRIPFSRVDTITIEGQIEVVSLSFINSNIQPAAPAGNANNFNPGFPGFPAPGNACPAGSMFGPPPPANPAGSMFAPPAFANPADSMFAPPAFANLQVPYKALIPGGLFVSRSIVIQGTVNPNCDNFCINLKPSDSLDIALHISPRFRTETAVVRNSCQQNSWGTEERTLAENLFSPGQAFEVTILCEASSFRVSVNGRHAFDFNHRFQPIQQINELQIDGDVTLANIRI